MSENYVHGNNANNMLAIHTYYETQLLKRAPKIRSIMSIVQKSEHALSKITATGDDWSWSIGTRYICLFSLPHDTDDEKYVGESIV